MVQGNTPTGQYGVEGRPFHDDLSQAACDRATRIAKTLFGGVDAQVILVHDSRVWRSREPGRHALGPGVRQVLERGQAIWVEDGCEDKDFASHPLVVGPPYLRFFAAHPIKLGDGSTPGVLAVSGLAPRPYDASFAGRLGDLADFVACEWERSQAAKAKERLRQERESTAAKFAAVIKALPVALVMTDHKYQILACSPSWAREMETTEEDAIGRPLSVVAPLAFDRWRAQIERVLQGETFLSEHVANPTADGKPGWISVDMAPWRQLDGQIGGVIASTHDVTDMVEALEAASRSEERLTLAMELSDIHVWEMDYARRELVKVGSEKTFFTEPTSYSELYRDPFSTIDSRDRAQAEAAWAAGGTSDGVFKQEYRVRRSDNKEVWTSSASRLISNSDGSPLRLIGAMQNITARKTVEAALVRAKDGAEAASYAKSAFLATMSHEIRTPLNGVLGMAQAMAASELSAVQSERLTVIRRSGENLLSILNDILDLSKIEAGKLELESVEFDMSELAKSLQALYSDVARGKGIELHVSVENPARGVYLGDVTRARQILQNLISNAVKFTEAGKVRVNISATQGGIDFFVSDTGIGVPADRIPLLFQKFEQADVSTTRRYGGTGLGLAICRELADLFGGSISASSVLGQGTDFCVFLPLHRVADESATPDPKCSVGVEHEELEKLQILAAEDNSVNQLVLRTLLNQAGIDPVIVSNGQEAVAAWRDRAWDVILMDVQMPIMDGPEASRTIRKLERELGRPRTPIIALTANAMSHQVAEYLHSGMDRFVAKPIEIDKLFSTIADVLDQIEAPNAELPQDLLGQGRS